MEERPDPGSDSRSEQPVTNRWRTLAVVATAIALVAVAIPFVWQPHVDSVETPDGAPVTLAASHEPGAGGEAIPGCMADAKAANWDFKLKDLDGKEVPLSTFKDSGKVVLLNFWATWCGPCKAEIPGFVKLQEKYKDKLTIVGYSVDDTADLAKKFASEYKMNYPILLGEGREDIQDAYGPIWGLPSTFIISKDGKVCRKHIGIAPEAVFEKEVLALMD